MNRLARKTFLYLSIAVFLLVAPTVIAYALGYSFDWQAKKPVLTGGFYFKSVPKNASIYIDNELKGETPAFLKRIIPKYYQVQIEKDGYQTWEKNLKVESQIVTEVKNILLIPENPELEESDIFPVKEEPLHDYRLRNGIVYKEDEQITLTPLKETCEIIAKNDNVVLLGKNLYLLEDRALRMIAQDVSSVQFSENNRLLYLTGNEIWVYDFGNKNRELITRSSQKIKQAIWYLNEHIIFSTQDAVKIVEIDNRDKRNIFNLAELRTEDIIYNEKIYFKTKDGIYSLGLK